MLRGHRPLLVIWLAFALLSPAWGDPPTDGKKAPDPDRPASGPRRMGSVRLRHDGPIDVLAFSSDGKLLASAGQDRTIRFWDAATWKELRKWSEQNKAIYAVAFSPDGKLFAATTEGAKPGSGLIRLWDAATGRPQVEFQADGMAGSLAFSPDGKVLAVSESKPGQPALVFRDAATGKQLQRINGSWTAAFSADGKLLATGTGGTILFQEPDSGKVVRELADRNDREQVGSLAFSPDGKLLAASGQQIRPRFIPTTWLWEVSTGKLLDRLEGWRRPVFSPDGKVLAVTDADTGDQGRLRFWDVAARKELRTADRGSGYVAAAFSPLGAGPSGKLGKTLAAIPNPPRTQELQLWEVDTGKRGPFPDRHSGIVYAVAFTPDGKALASAGYDRTVRVWETATGKELRRFETKGPALRVVFSPDGRALAGATTEGQVYLWGWSGGKESLHFDAHKGGISSLAFTPDGKTLATAGGDRGLCLWDVARGTQVRRIVVSEDSLPALGCSGDGSTLWAVRKAPGADQVSVWEVATGKEIITKPIPYSHTYGFVFSPGGKSVAFVDRDVCYVQETATGEQVLRLMAPEPVGLLAYSRDGRLLVTATNNVADRSVWTFRLWELGSGKELLALPGPRSQVVAVAFSPDGRSLASGGPDGDVFLWDLAPRGPDRARGTDEPGPKDLQRWWAVLGGEDGPAAYEGVWGLTAARQKAVPFLKDQLLPPDVKGREERIRKLIADLDSEDFLERESASKELEKFGEAAAPLLRKALEGEPSGEVRKRAEALLVGLKAREVLPQSGKLAGGPVRIVRAVWVLERIGGKEAEEVLKALARGKPGTLEVEEAKAALKRLQGE
jgi:WD40 repeat protein